MKKILSALILFTLTITTALAQDTLNGSFNAMRISGSAKVYVRQSAQCSVTLTGQNNEDGISISNNKLYISRVFAEPIYITVPGLKYIDVSGNGEIIMDSIFTIDNLQVNVSGNCKTDWNIKGGSVELDVSGNFTGTIKGTADALDVNVSGRANVFATDLTVKNCNVDVSGLSKVLVDVKDSLNTRISGKGTVVYKNPPAYTNNNSSGLARLGDSKESVRDTTKLNFGKTTVLIIGNEDNYQWKSKDSLPKSKFHWAGVELGFNNYVNSDNKFDVPPGYHYLDLNTGKSVFVNLNLFECKLKLYHEYIMLGTGFGFSFRNYRFANKDSILIPGADFVSAAASDQSYTKYKLAVNYITVPALLEFNTNRYNKKSFHFGGGVVFNYKIGSYIKLKSDEGKQKIHNNFNINPLGCDARVHVGFGNLNVFASYGLTSLFKDNHGPEVRPVSIGITLLGW